MNCRCKNMIIGAQQTAALQGLHRGFTGGIQGVNRAKALSTPFGHLAGCSSTRGLAGGCFHFPVFLLFRKALSLSMTNMVLNDPQLAEFLSRKSAHSKLLLAHLVSAFDEIGAVDVYATKTMVGFRRRRNFAYIIQFGKGFIDFLLPFKEPFEDNLCFRKITMPGDGDYNHHIRIMEAADINEEVRVYLKKAFDLAG